MDHNPKGEPGFHTDLKGRRITGFYIPRLIKATSGFQYLKAHWLGLLPLWAIIWINTVGAYCFLNLLVLAALHLAGELSARTTAYFPLLYWSIVALIFPWQLVGIARSVARYFKQGSGSFQPLFSCAIALVVICIGVTNFLLSGSAQLSDSIDALRGDPQWPSPSLLSLPNGTEMEFSGIIKVDSSALLSHFLQTHPGIRILQLDTIGGRDNEASQMANVVRRYQLSTYVSRECDSCGVIVFLAGVQRYLRTDARLGFHSWGFPGIATPNANDRQIGLLLANHVSSSFISKAISTPVSSIWFPTDSELLAEGIVTNLTDGHGFSLGSRELMNFTEAGLLTLLNNDPRMKALANRMPVAYRAAVANAAALFAKGSDRWVALNGVNQLLATAIQEAKPTASDEAVDACLDLDLAILKRNMYVAPKETLMVISLVAPKSVVPDFPYEADKRYVALLLSSRTQSAPNANQISSPNAAMYLREHPAIGATVRKIPNGIPSDVDSQIAACEAIQTIFEQLKGLPPETRLPIIRQIFAYWASTQSIRVTAPK